MTLVQVTPKFFVRKLQTTHKHTQTYSQRQIPQRVRENFSSHKVKYIRIFDLLLFFYARRNGKEVVGCSPCNDHFMLFSTIFLQRIVTALDGVSALTALKSSLLPLFNVPPP